MSFFTSDNVSRVHLLELLIMSTKIESLIESLESGESDDSNIDYELYTTYKAIYDKLQMDSGSNDLHITFVEYLEDTLFEFKLEINQRRRN